MEQIELASGSLEDVDIAENPPGNRWSAYEMLRPTGKGQGFQSRQGRYIIACTLLACLSSALLGYDTGVMSGAVLFIEEDLHIHTLQKEVLVGSLNMVSIVGAALAGWLSDAVGRRAALGIASSLFMFGAVIMAASASYSVLLIGRIITGIGVGFAFTVAPAYTAELSPAQHRGFLVSIFEFSINIGILLGYWFSYLLSDLPTDVGWRVMLGIGTIPAAMLGLGLLFVPESPRWLVLVGRTAQARDVLGKTSADAAEAETRLDEILRATALHASLTEELQDVASNPSLQPSPTPAPETSAQVWHELIVRPSPAVRRMLVVALGTNFFQQATGIDALVYYSPAVFQSAGVRSKAGRLAATTLMGVAKCVFVYLGALLMDRAGRRRLLLTSAGGMTVSLVVLGVGLNMLGDLDRAVDGELPATTTEGAKGGAGPPLAILAVCIYVAFYSVGFGPVNWVLSSEIWPLQLRSQALGLCTVTNRFVSGAVAMSFLSLSDAITPSGVFFLFSLLGCLAFIFHYRLTPETKGKALEEIETMFAEIAGVRGLPHPGHTALSGGGGKASGEGRAGDGGQGDGAAEGEGEGEREGRRGEGQEMPLLPVESGSEKAGVDRLELTPLPSPSLHGYQQSAKWGNREEN